MPFNKGKGFGDSGGGGSLPPKIINVPADYPTLIEATINMGRHYYIGGDPSVTDNDPTKTDTGQTFLLGQDIMWDGISAYFKVGDNAIWGDDGSTVKTVNLRNIDMQGKGFLNMKSWTTIATTDADYNNIETAIAAGHYNLLVLGDFTQPTDITTTVADLINIHIVERLTTENVDFDLGPAGIKVRNAIWRFKFTGATNKIFKSSAGTVLDIADISFVDNGSTTANSGIANIFNRSQHLIHNSTFDLSNTSESGFLNAGSNSSFTNLSVRGGGASCDNFIKNASNAIISDIIISGTVANSGYFITTGGISDIPCVINNILYGAPTNPWVLQTLSHGTILSNIKGNIQWEPGTANNHHVSNCQFQWIDGGDGTSNNEISNVKITGAFATTFSGTQNQIVNFKLVDDLTITGNANKITNVSAVDILVSGDNNQLLLTDSTTYTDNGTGNSNSETISEDVLMTSDSNRKLITEHVAKTYADNIAKGITVDYYFSDIPDGVIANYDIMFPSDTGQSESTAAASIPAADTLIQTFITQTTEPNFTTLLAGIYDIHIHAAKTTGTKDVFIYAEFYKRAAGGSETLLATSDNSALLTSSNVGYTLHFSLLNDEIIETTARLVVKFYGSPAGTGTDPTATLYLEGANASRIDIHTTSSSWMLNLQNIIYVNGAGNDSNAGKNMGTPKLTIAAALTAAALQIPSATNIIVVKVIGGLRYAEDVTVPSWVVLDMKDAISNGQITVGVTMGADAFYDFNEAIMPSGKEAVRCVGAGNRYIKGNFTTPETNSIFLTASGAASIYLDIANADAVKTGAKFYAIDSGVHLYLDAHRFAETVASTSDAASNVVAHIGEVAVSGITRNINHAGNFVFEGLATTGYVGFGGTNSTTYPQTKKRHHSGVLAAAGSFVAVTAAMLGLNSGLQVVNARVFGYYPAASAWMPDGSIWGEGINLRVGSTGIQIETPAGSTGMAGQNFHLVYEYQQTNFLV